MRLHWNQSGLGIEPEDAHEAALLGELAKPPLKWGRSGDGNGPGESTEELGGESLFNLSAADQKIAPRRLAGQRRNQQPVVAIDKPH